MDKHFDVLIIGGGVMGASAAWHLSRLKQLRVGLVEQLSIQNYLNSSQDENKVFRWVYADNKYYTEMAMDSLPYWQMLEQEAEMQVLYQNGLLLLTNHDNEFAHRSLVTMRELNAPCQWLSQEEVNEHYPAFKVRNALLDPNGGFTDAHASVEAMIKVAKLNGVEVIENQKIVSVSKGRAQSITGNTYTAHKILFCGGAWANKLLSLPIVPTRQQIVYFRPKDPVPFEKSLFPVFAYFENGFYGFPIHKSGLIKVSKHIPGDHADPDNASHRLIDADFIDECRDFFREHIPSLVDAKDERYKVCLYSMTENEDFIIDEYQDGVWVAAGFSGHGFKFAPLIGKILSELVVTGHTSYDISRFKLRTE